MSAILSESFRQQWVTGCLLLPQFLFQTRRRSARSRVCDLFIPRTFVPGVGGAAASRGTATSHRLKDNQDVLEAGTTNTRWLANGDYYRSRFVEVPPADVLAMVRYDAGSVGARTGGTVGPAQPWAGAYPSVPNQTGSDPHSDSNPVTLYRGLAGTDWIALLKRVGVI